MNGMPALKTIAKQMKLFAPGNLKDRRLATQLGFTAQGWADRALAAQRIVGESVGPEWAQKLSDVVLRATFLSPWTEAGRYAFQMEMAAHITNQVAKPFGKLDSATRNSFVRNGINEQDWDLIRNTPLWKDPESGAEFLRAEDITDNKLASAKFEAANKFQSAIFNETNYAIIGINPTMRAVLTGGAPAGTFWGEVMRSVALFKGFPLTVLHQHLFGRMLAQKNIARKLEYAGLLFIGMSAFGVLGEQLNSIASGKDPVKLDKDSLTSDNGYAFLAKSVMRGGSLGLLGDMVFNDANRWGGGLYSGLLGPVARQTEDAFKLMIGNVQQLLAGKETNAGREISRFIQANTPGRSAWYAKLALERMLFDQFDHYLDPNSRRGFRRVEKRAREDFGQKFYWRPGKMKPRRAPDMNIFSPR